MQTLSKTEIEKVAGRVAAILRAKVKGNTFTDPLEPQTWIDAASGICSVVVRTDRTRECGYCISEPDVDNVPKSHILISASGSYKRPGYIARLLIHELSHAVLWHFAPEVFTATPWQMVENPYQAAENICRAVERHFLGEFGHGWLPAHGYYWS